MAAYDPKAEARAKELAIKKWYDDRENKLTSQLVKGKYPAQLTPEEVGYIPERFFQHATVQAKFDEMKKNESIDPSNKQRMPEKYPYYTPELMEKYLNSLANEQLPTRNYSIGIAKEQPNVVFFDSIPEFTIEKNKFKIHLMFNVKYMDEVLPILFHELIGKGFPVTFKVLNFNPVTSIVNRAGTFNPTFDANYDYGVNRAKKLNMDV